MTVLLNLSFRAKILSAVIVVQCLSCIPLFVTPWTAARQALLSSSVSRSLLTFMSIELVMLSNQVNLHCPLLLLPLIFLSVGTFLMSQLFTSGGQNIRASASVTVLQWKFRLISFRIDWFGLLSVQGALRSLLQHYSSKATILQCSAFFMIQLSHLVHDYWKNHSFDYMNLCWQSDLFASFNISSISSPRVSH